MTAQLEQRGRELQDLRTQQGYQLDALIAEAISLDPNGAKIGGSKFSLVALIPKVIKSLPGIVKITT